MELTLDFDDSLVLEIRFSGELEACLSPGRKPAATDTEQEAAPASVRNARTARKTTRTARTRAIGTQSPSAQSAQAAAPDDSGTAAASPALEAPAAPSASMAPAAAEAGDDPSALPAEVSRLPKKHQDFYVRKYGEYLEVYPAEKARELALQAVRSIAGGPR